MHYYELKSTIMLPTWWCTSLWSVINEEFHVSTIIVSQEIVTTVPRSHLLNSLALLSAQLLLVNCPPALYFGHLLDAFMNSKILAYFIALSKSKNT